jgi:cold shock CspA family protein
MGKAVSAGRLLGRIQRTFLGWKGKGHGFIATDNHEKFFFHQDDVIGQLTPPEGSLVTFNVIRQPVKPPPKPGSPAATIRAEKKSVHDRAVNIQIETMPQ